MTREESARRTDTDTNTKTVLEVAVKIETLLTAFSWLCFVSKDSSSSRSSFGLKSERNEKKKERI